MSVQRRGIRALEIWCQRVTSSYSNVDVSDLSTSFRDGLAFCAIIHHFRPDLIEFESLSADKMLENNALAFRIAEEKLGIPALLDPEDMVDSDTPDKFSVATYLAQFYHLFKDDDDSRTSSPKTRLVLRGSESSETSSSAEGTPLGTPTLATKGHLFNPKDLIEKYGEDIFSKSSNSSPMRSPAISTPTTVIKTPTLVTKSPMFNPKDLMEKYGEDIFSKSSNSDLSSPKRVSGQSPNVASVCKEFELKNRVSCLEKQQS